MHRSTISTYNIDKFPLRFFQILCLPRVLDYKWIIIWKFGRLLNYVKPINLLNEDCCLSFNIIHECIICRQSQAPLFPHRPLVSHSFQNPEMIMPLTTAWKTYNLALFIDIIRSTAHSSSPSAKRKKKKTITTTKALAFITKQPKIEFDEILSVWWMCN